MKIAIMLFNGTVAPRADIADEIIIYEIDNKKIVNKVKYNIFFVPYLFFNSLLMKIKIKLIICGSCPQPILRIIHSYGSDVILNRMGDPEQALKIFLDRKGSVSKSSKKDIPINQEKNSLKYFRRLKNGKN